MTVLRRNNPTKVEYQAKEIYKLLDSPITNLYKRYIKSTLILKVKYRSKSNQIVKKIIEKR